MRQRRCQQVKEKLAPAHYAPVLALLVVLKLVSDYTHHDIVRNEPASIHDLLRLHTERRLLRHLLAQQVARREVTHTELVAYSRRLRALACASRRVASSAREAKKKKKERETRTCAWGPNENSAELLRWRWLLRHRFCLELRDLVGELAYERLEIRKLVRGRHFLEGVGVRCWWWVVLEDLKTQDNSKVRLSRLNPELIFGPGRSVENYT